MEKEAIQLLEIIRSKDCSDHLMQIREGSIPSSRHKKYAREELMHSGLGPFTLFHDLVCIWSFTVIESSWAELLVLIKCWLSLQTAELLTALDNLCDEHEDHPDYKQKVMLPEVQLILLVNSVDLVSIMKL